VNSSESSLKHAHTYTASAESIIVYIRIVRVRCAPIVFVKVVVDHHVANG
jgi:hypothetical protein